MRLQPNFEWLCSSYNAARVLWLVFALSSNHCVKTQLFVESEKIIIIAALFGECFEFVHRIAWIGFVEAGRISIFPGLLVLVDLVLVLAWLQVREVLWAPSENTENPVTSLLRAGLKTNVMNWKIMNRKGSSRMLIWHKMLCLEMWFSATGKFSSVDKALLKKKKEKKTQTKRTPECPWAEFGK